MNAQKMYKTERLYDGRGQLRTMIIGDDQEKVRLVRKSLTQIEVELFDDAADDHKIVLEAYNAIQILLGLIDARALY